MTAGPSHAIVPRLDAIGPAQRLDPHAPIVYAYLGGRPVALVRPDPRSRRRGGRARVTVPITMSRLEHAYDIERGYDRRAWEPTPLWGLGKLRHVLPALAAL